MRSTTCVIDAAINHLPSTDYTPIMVFPEQGPWQQELKNNGVTTHIRPFSVPEKSKPFQFLANFLYWVRLIKLEKISLIHLNEHDNFPMIRHAACYCKVPVIVGVRFVLEGGYARWAFGGKYKPAKLLFTSQDQINRSITEIPRGIPEEDIILFGNGRDLKQFTQVESSAEKIRQNWEVEPKHFVLGTASVIRRRKLLEDFILLVGKLKDKGMPVKGIIAGGGRFADPVYFQELEQLIVKEGLSDSVKMIGNLDDIAPFYQGIDLFVSTSELETFGMSVCEAMAFAKPVIGYSGGSVAEVLGDKSCIVDVKDFSALVDLAAKFVTDPKLVKDKGNKGYIRAFEHFDAPMLAQRLDQIYKQVFNDNK